MKFKFLSLLTLLVAMQAVTLVAQDRDRFENIVRTLSSEEFCGRSLAGDGIVKTREYIISNLSPQAAWQYQEFSFPMNVYDGKLEAYKDGKKMELFKDYIVKEFSPAAKGTYPVYYLPNDCVTKDKFYNALNREEMAGKFVVIDFDLLRENFFIDTAPDYNLCISYDNYQQTLGKLSYVAGVVLTQKGRPVSYKARAHYTLPFPVLVADESFGNDVKEITIDIEATMHPRYNAKNIVAWLPGKNKECSKYTIFVAHMDHLGIFGKGNVMFGANDNASGVAALLTLMEYYAKEANRPEESLLFLFTDGEESNLLGSHFYVKSPLKPLEDCRYVIDLDMVGDNAQSLSYVITPSDEESFKKLCLKNGFNTLNKIEFTDYCDFYPFGMKGVPYIYLSVDGVNKDKYYHSPSDNLSTFSSSQYERLFNLVIDFVANK